MRERPWQKRPRPKAPVRRSKASRRDRYAGKGARYAPVILYGWHTVTAALANPARHIRRFATENAAGGLPKRHLLAVEPELVRPGARGAADARCRASGPARRGRSPALACARGARRTGIVLVLDQITDPHNVGAILRTAAAFAVGAIVTTARHSPEATGVLAKSASGALEFVPMVLCRTLRAGSRR